MKKIFLSRMLLLSAFGAFVGSLSAAFPRSDAETFSAVVREDDSVSEPDSVSYQTALEYRTDANSIVSKVNFVDPAAGDFRIADSSPEVFRMGFQNFEMNR
ncbi:MAG: hypothetical protein LBJ47_00445, partial [Tannerella sp.]|nr:hypothetical protein [Tannerella sp.]